MNNNCFVIMPIGTQEFNGATITQEILKEKYNNLIKEAILKANPNLEVIRADEELNPGTISNDIFLKLMHSKYVIADITYPNPNVFYELGIRHSISNQTILIREKTTAPVPFDISHLKYIEYENTVSGLSNLSKNLKERFEFYSSNPYKLDNQFLELCSLTNFFPSIYKNFIKEDEDEDNLLLSIFNLFLSNPKLFEATVEQTEENRIFFEALNEHKESLPQLIKTINKFNKKR